MRAFRFMHVADLHLGSPFIGLARVSPVIRKRLGEAIYTSLTHMVDLAIAKEVDFIVVCGDVFDQADRTLGAGLRLQQAAKRLASEGIAVYMICGNHDPLDETRPMLDLPDNVHVFGGGEVRERVACRRDGAEVARIYGISFDRAHIRDNLALRFPVVRQRRDGLFHLALLHANVDAQPDYDNYAPCSRDDLSRTGMDYWALGHIHVRQIVSQSPWIVYPGNLQGRSIKEDGAKGVYVADVSERGMVDLAFHEVDEIRWITRTLDITGLQTEQDWLNRVREIWREVFAEHGGRSAVIRLVCEGSGVLHDRIADAGWLQDWLDEARSEQESKAGNGGSFLWPESVLNRTMPHSGLDLEGLRREDHFLGEVLRMATRDKERLLSGDRSMPALEPLLSNYKVSRYLGEIKPDVLLAWTEEAERLAVHWLGDVVEESERSNHEN